MTVTVRRRSPPSWTSSGGASSAWRRKRWKRWRPSTKSSWKTFFPRTSPTIFSVLHTGRRFVCFQTLSELRLSSEDVSEQLLLRLLFAGTTATAATPLLLLLPLISVFVQPDHFICFLQLTYSRHI